jgi:hypothetical protein
LRSRRDGFSVQFRAKTGERKQVTVDADMIDRQLEAIDAARAASKAP